MNAKDNRNATNGEEFIFDRRNILLGVSALAVAVAAFGASTPVAVTQAQAQPAPSGRKPNILFIMSDDIGWFNLSATTSGSWDIARRTSTGSEGGAVFTDFYGQQSCTAGRAAFITGQSPIRTGLTKVGLPGATVGLRAADPSIADFFKNLGYATGQFGKNHLGDRNELLPTVHGFDEFFGDLYHLNAEEEPENPDYPEDARISREVRTTRCAALQGDGKDDTTVDPQFGRVGKQTIENTGPLTRSGWKRWTKSSSLQPRILSNASKEGKPWFCTSTRLGCTSGHISRPLPTARPASASIRMGWSELDGYIGELLKKLESLALPTTPSSSTPPTMAQK